MGTQLVLAPIAPELAGYYCAVVLGIRSANNLALCSKMLAMARRSRGQWASTSRGPCTTARTFVLPISRNAEPSTRSNSPILVLSFRTSPRLRPSVRRPDRLMNSVFDPIIATHTRQMVQLRWLAHTRGDERAKARPAYLYMHGSLFACMNSTIPPSKR